MAPRNIAPEDESRFVREKFRELWEAAQHRDEER